MIDIQSFVFGPFMENTYVISDETKECIIIDPGCYEEDENQELLSYIAKEKLKVKKLINSHCHIDHVLGNDLVKRSFGVALYAHKIEIPYLKSVEAYAPNYGFANFTPSEIDEFIDEGDSIAFGNTTLDVLFVPGHSPGHIALVHKEEKFCISGDVLFNQSIGRTDLPGGDFETLIQSIQEKLFKLDDDYVIFCGHGPNTTIGQEKKSNPFCAIKSN